MISNKTIKKILQFRKERNWEQFHTIKDLCLGLGIESAELQEIFLWKSDNQISEIKKNQRDVIGDELADIFIFLTYISNDMGIDLDKAINRKLQINENNYPVSKSRGVNKKYNEL